MKPTISGASKPKLSTQARLLLERFPRVNGPVLEGDSIPGRFVTSLFLDQGINEMAAIEAAVDELTSEGLVSGSLTDGIELTEAGASYANRVGSSD